MISGRGLASVIVQVCVPGSKPETGTFRSGAVEAGMSKTMLSTPGLESALASMIAWRERARAAITGIGDDEGRDVASLLLVIVSVAELIAPRVAPAAGWLSVRLTVE